jgi:tagaturonate reductase
MNLEKNQTPVTSVNSAAFPEKVLQFGEGNFLRGFCDWMIDQMNRKGLFQGRIVVVQPIEQGLADLLNERNGEYHLGIRGLQQGELVDDLSNITAISRAINPYRNFDEYLACAENPELRYIISNTTESGIAYAAGEKADARPPVSFPAKLTVFFYHRYKHFQGAMDKGFVVLPCELIERNGDQLKEIMVRLAQEWGLEQAFIEWIEKANKFTNTLVDRIVTGYPKDEIAQFEQRLGFKDPLLDTAEPFHLWVIEGDTNLANELPLVEAGLNVIWTNDMTPYRTRKVRILNGAHTMTVLGAYLAGKDTVKECMDDEMISAFMKNGLYNEIIPTLDLSKEELESFASAVLERFANPFIKHYLLSIALNSVSKFKTRLLPSITEYSRRTGKAPRVLGFSLAALLAFYRGTEIKDGALIGTRGAETYRIQDDAAYLEWFQKHWAACDNSLEAIREFTAAALSNTVFWGEDLTMIEGFLDIVSSDLHQIVTIGAKEAMQKIV